MAPSTQNETDNPLAALVKLAEKLPEFDAATNPCPYCGYAARHGISPDHDNECEVKIGTASDSLAYPIAVKP